MIKEIVEKSYDNMVNRVSPYFNLYKIEKNKREVTIKASHRFKDIDNFIKMDPDWATEEKIFIHLRYITTTTSIVAKLKEEEIIKMFIDVWGMKENEVISNKWNQLSFASYKTGKFVRGSFDYKIELELDLEDETKENYFYKALYLKLPSECKWIKFQNIFGNSSFKYKEVILETINSYFEKKLLTLKEEEDNLIYALTKYYMENFLENKSLENE
jgi:hypothetical protein